MEEAFAKALADKVLEALDGPQRDGILAKGVAEALKGWEFKSACAKLIEERAKKKAAEIVESGVYDEQIAAAIRAAMDKILQTVEGAAKKCLLTALFGQKDDARGYGGNPGIILRHFE